MQNGKAKVFLIFTATILFVCITTLVVWLFRMDTNMRERISKGWFLPPLEIYSQAYTVFERQQLSPQELVARLKQDRFRQREQKQKLFPGDYSVWESEFCQEYINDSPDNLTNCVIFKTPELDYGPHREPEVYLTAFTENQVAAIYQSDELQKVDQWQIPPRLFAQFFGGKPILRQVSQIAETPMYCLNATTAIEDSAFLEHRGVSPTGILRALVRNILEGRYAQGGSTITQQLVRNYFLTLEKKLSRKIKELFMSILLELRVDKDEILQTYLNVIYMGQNGPFQVRGFGAAAQHYFSKPLEKLELHECALLAAIINSPGLYNPFTKPESAFNRRNLVLKRMVETQVLDEVEAKVATQKPLPLKPPQALVDPAPYFVQALQRELKENDIDTEQGLRVFTTMSESAQQTAQSAVKNGVKNLEEAFLSLIEKKKAGNNLEASLIAINLKTGGIEALVGGRGYKKTQYNRVLDAHRQVGSIMKPFVYLSALESLDENGETYTPLSLIPDEKFTHEYEGQSWSPKNYSGTFHGNIPLFYALKNSINAATAKIGIDTGLSSIVDVATRAGVTSPMQAFPSLTLGAFEIYPIEVARAYATIARMGESINLHSISHIEDLSGSVVYENESFSETMFTPATVGVLVGMMKQTLQTGTGRLAKLRGFTKPAAGKTGTTSDTKDAWFAGFTPHQLAIVWVGYDKNISHGLTGATGALPIWTNFMKSYASKYPDDDFTWPEGAVTYQMPASNLSELVSSPKPHELEGELELIFRVENKPGF